MNEVTGLRCVTKETKQCGVDKMNEAILDLNKIVESINDLDRYIRQGNVPIDDCQNEAENPTMPLGSLLVEGPDIIFDVVNTCLNKLNTIRNLLR